MDPQKQLKFGTEYPKRPPFWFAQAIRIMSHCAVAQDVGLLGYAILTEVVLTEDKIGYARAPLFWQRSFQDRFNRGKEAVSEAIDKCVDHGWLHWDQPANNRQAIAWLTLPAWVDVAVINRGWSEIPTDYPPNNPPNRLPDDLPNNPPYSSLSQPIPLKPDDWAAVVEGMSKIGICETSEPLRRLQEHRVPIGLALDVLRHATETKLWKPAKVRCRLMQLKPGQDPQDRRLWMQPDFGLVHPAAAAVVPADRQQLSQLRQLELQFGDQVKNKSVAELATLFELPESLKLRLQNYQQWESIRSDSIRFDVLRAVQMRCSN